MGDIAAGIYIYILAGAATECSHSSYKPGVEEEHWKQRLAFETSKPAPSVTYFPHKDTPPKLTPVVPPTRGQIFRSPRIWRTSHTKHHMCLPLATEQNPFWNKDPSSYCQMV